MDYSSELLAAVAVLDKDQPGWWRKVDLDDFSLRTSRCVLGQIHGLTPDATVQDWVNAWKTIPIGNSMVFHAYSDLEPQWRSLISERQSADEFSLSIPDPREEEVEGMYGTVAERIAPYTLATALDMAEEKHRYAGDET